MDSQLLYGINVLLEPYAISLQTIDSCFLDFVLILSNCVTLVWDAPCLHDKDHVHSAIYALLLH
jgi:hypothetical protein